MHQTPCLSHRWTKAALFTFLLSSLLLLMQAPFFFHDMRSADTVYHAARIDRTLLGQPLIDPFSGTETVYPPFFHLMGAGLASVFHLTGEETIHFLGMATYIFLALSLFFFAYSLLQDTRLASLFCLFFSFVHYAPSTKYLLLQGPATFSHPFIFLGMGAYFHFRNTKNARWLYTGAFLLAVGCQIWWFNLFLAAPFLATALTAERGFLTKKVVFRTILCFLLPFFATLCQLYLIRHTLPNYLQEGEKATRELLRPFVSTLLLKGQGDYLETLPPWKWHYDPHTSWMKTGRDAVNFVFFFLLSLPSSLFIPLAACYLTLRKKIAIPLFLLFLLPLLFSILLLFKGNTAHLYRVQLYTGALALLLLIGAISSMEVPIKALRQGVKTLAFLACFFTLWHVLHNPLTIGKREFHLPEDQETALYIRKLPAGEKERILFTDSSYRSLVTLTPFYSLVGNRNGSYYFQDPVTSRKMEQAYQTFIGGRHSQENIEEYPIRLMGFDKTDPVERLLLKRYRNEGEVAFENAKWTLLKIDH
ncbi:hypothetical protein [Estrella lausannensis]|uniref:Putative membrane protein n=1 Tax=Estrella lausannensis TaxID=483423 RepID=A0A0H5DRE4_9BACT|nr:hypothetical protein [Estrella lausannensis]CRX38758.1 putative membrane protein [Estrella lausannensis]